MAKHILLSSVGIWNRSEDDRKPTKYNLNDIQVEHYYSAFGLHELLSDRPDEIWFILTPKAFETQGKKIQEEATRLDLCVNTIELSDEVDDTRLFLEKLSGEIPQGCELTLDVTQGLRHHAFLTYSLALYLTTFRGVSIRGAWYCNVFSKTNEKPFIDLKPTLDLADWFHAISNFQRYGFTDDMGRLIQRTADGFRKAEKSFRQRAGKDPALNKEASDIGRGAREFEKYKSDFDKYSLHFMNGLPLELGLSSTQLTESITPFPDSLLGRSLPLSQELIDLVQCESEKWKMDPGKEKDSPKNIELRSKELKRQAQIIDRYFEAGFFALALGMLREWIISWMILHKTSGDEWQDRDCRESQARILNGLSKAISNDNLKYEFPAELIEFVGNWERVVQLRNAFHHHGMNETITNPTKTLEKIRVFWTALKNDELLVPKAGGDAGRLLICPIGNSPGVLYSAILNLKHVPDRVLVICSSETRTTVDEAILKANYPKENLEIVEMDNPFTGYGEFPTIINKLAPWLFRADEVFANLTGGTTLMGVLIGEILNYAKYKLQRDVRKFILIDKRTPQEQREKPWVKSDIHFLAEEKTEETNNKNSKKG